MKIPVRGPGRPRKWKGPTDIITLRLPLEIIGIIDDIASETGKSRTDVIVALAKAASNVQVTKLLLRIDSLEEYIKQLEKENQALLEERDKLIEKIEKLEFKLEAYEKGRSAVTSRGSRIIDALASAFEEGKTWAQVCEEVGIFTPQEQVEILNKFFVTKDDSDKFAKVFRPLKSARKFKGWILVKGNAESIVDYVLARDDTLKAAQSLKRVEVEKEEARAISIEQAKVDLREKFFNIYLTYQQYLEAGKEKEALRFLQDVQDGFEKLVEKYGLDLIEDVINEDFRFVELFGSLLSALKASKKKKPVEVVANE